MCSIMAAAKVRFRFVPGGKGRPSINRLCRFEDLKPARPVDRLQGVVEVPAFVTSVTHGPTVAGS